MSTGADAPAPDAGTRPTPTNGARAARRGRALVVDDDAAMTELLAVGLRRRGFEVLAFTSPADAVAALERESFEVVLTDLNMRGMGGLALCAKSLAFQPDVPVVVITAFGSISAAVEAMRAGAYDFVTKPVELDMLELTLARAVEHCRLRRHVRRLEGSVVEADAGFGGLVGASPAMQRIYELCARVADSDVTVLVSGESGTGKELVARALHDRSRRAPGPFVALNCAALPEALLESELFGHARGAFTDARTARPGLLLAADGGTLFLDEIGEMPLGMQARLLRALQERSVRPVGAEREVSFDARIVAATNRDIEASVDAGTFRSDLYFRIAVVRVHLPALRARGSDVLLLARHLLERATRRMGKEVTRIGTEAAQKLLDYEWPGNVRELQNCVDHAVALARGAEVGVADLPERVRSYRRSDVIVAATDAAELVTLEEVERRYIERVLEAVGGNRTAAARVLGLDRKTLYRKLERWGPQDD